MVAVMKHCASTVASVAEVDTRVLTGRKRGRITTKKKEKQKLKNFICKNLKKFSWSI